MDEDIEKIPDTTTAYLNLQEKDTSNIWSQKVVNLPRFSQTSEFYATVSKKKPALTDSF